MKNNSFILLFVIFVFSGCVNFQVPNISMINTNSNYQLTTDDFKIIGIVEAQGTTKCILGLFIFGGNGFSAIHSKAKAMGGDDVIGYTVDIKQAGLFPIYVKQTWQARASVIKFTDKAVNRELFNKNFENLKITGKIDTGATNKNESTKSGNPGNIIIKREITEAEKKTISAFLMEWRRQTANEKGVEASSICSIYQINIIADKVPRTVQELRKISEVPLVTTDTYGEEIINIINDFLIQKGGTVGK